MLQHGSYTLLIDACYDREQFPTAEQALEWTWACSEAEIEAVNFVLRKFFALEDGVYVQKRIQEEIFEYHNKSLINKRIAIDRETKRHETCTNRARIVHEPPPNQEPVTSNQEPVTKEPKVKNRDATAARLPADWKPTDTDIAFLKTNRPELVLERIEGGFRDYWHSVPGAKGRKLDWAATWRNWVRNQKQDYRVATNGVETPYQRQNREQIAGFAPNIAARAKDET